MASKMRNVKLPADGKAVDAEIDLCNSGDVYFLRARLNVSLAGDWSDAEIAQAIVDATHSETCCIFQRYTGQHRRYAQRGVSRICSSRLQGLRRLFRL